MSKVRQVQKYGTVVLAETVQGRQGGLAESSAVGFSMFLDTLREYVFSFSLSLCSSLFLPNEATGLGLDHRVTLSVHACCSVPPKNRIASLYALVFHFASII